LPTKLDWQDLKWISEDETGFNLAHSPTPLSEEILLKCGFEKSLFYNNTYHLKINTLNGSNDIFIDISAKVALIGTIEIGKFEHLHQLQNLTHSLGQELNIEL